MTVLHPEVVYIDLFELMRKRDRERRLTAAKRKMRRRLIILVAQALGAVATAVLLWFAVVCISTF